MPIEQPIRCQIEAATYEGQSPDCDGDATHVCWSCGDPCCESCSSPTRDPRLMLARNCDCCEANRMVREAGRRTMLHVYGHLIDSGWDEYSLIAVGAILSDLKTGWQAVA